MAVYYWIHGLGTTKGFEVRDLSVGRRRMAKGKHAVLERHHCGKKRETNRGVF